MNTDQIASLLRSLLKFIGGLLVAHGLKTAAAVVNAEDTVGAIMTLGGFVWSHYKHSDANPKAPPTILLIVLLLPALSFGCNATLDPAGPYSGDKFLYDMDGVVIEARGVFDGFLTWEMQNRAALKAENKQSVTAAADAVRTNAPVWFGVVSAARGAYMSAKGPATSNSLFQAVTIVQTQELTTKAVTNFAAH